VSLPLTAVAGGPGATRMTPQSPQAASQDLAEPVSGNSEFEDAWAQGFKFLRFPPALEVRYRQDKEADRLRLIRIGTMFIVVMTCILLVTDWIMVPDQFRSAVGIARLRRDTVGAGYLAQPASHGPGGARAADGFDEPDHGCGMYIYRGQKP
jgi:hypothetical protein